MNFLARDYNIPAVSYTLLRRVIGLIGTLFPFVLGIGGFIVDEIAIQSSISSYYHTGMRDVFVGFLFVISFFLMSYTGYDRSDTLTGILACFFGLGVALIPTEPDIVTHPRQVFIGWIHLTFAALFFLTLAYFSIFLFTKTHPGRTLAQATPQKRLRNGVYIICGILMIACLALIVIVIYPPGPSQPIGPIQKPIYWLEAIAIVAFGISWLTKGEAIPIFNDRT